MSTIIAIVCFALITMSLITFEIIYTYAKRGFEYGFSSNRPAVEHSEFELRIKRTLQNHVESAAYIVPVLLAAELSQIDTPGVELAALLIVAGRAAYSILYYTGIPFIRIPAFSLASLSTVYLAVVTIVHAV